jgi:hypothetical protein
MEKFAAKPSCRSPGQARHCTVGIAESESRERELEGSLPFLRPEDDTGSYNTRAVDAEPSLSLTVKDTDEFHKLLER